MRASTLCLQRIDSLLQRRTRRRQIVSLTHDPLGLRLHLIDEQRCSLELFALASDRHGECAHRLLELGVLRAKQLNLPVDLDLDVASLGLDAGELLPTALLLGRHLALGSQQLAARLVSLALGHALVLRGQALVQMSLAREFSGEFALFERLVARC